MAVVDIPSSSWSDDLPDGLLTTLVSAGVVRTLAEGAAVYRAGDVGDGLNAIISGEVRLVGHSESGRRLVYLVAGAGQWFGEMSVIDRRSRLHDAVCSMQSRILHVPEAAVYRLAEDDPRLVWALGRLVCEHQRSTLAFIDRALTASADVRLAVFLLAATTREGSEASLIRLTRDEIAAMIGLSRQGLEPVLARLVKADIIRASYGQVEVLDRAALRLAART